MVGWHPGVSLPPLQRTAVGFSGGVPGSRGAPQGHCAVRSPRRTVSPPSLRSYGLPTSLPRSLHSSRLLFCCRVSLRQPLTSPSVTGDSPSRQTAPSLVIFIVILVVAIIDANAQTADSERLSLTLVKNRDNIQTMFPSTQ